MNDKTLAGSSKTLSVEQVQKLQRSVAEMGDQNGVVVAAWLIREMCAKLLASGGFETGELQRLRGLLEAIAAREPEARRAVAAGEYNTTFAIDLASMARLGLEGTLYGHAQKANDRLEYRRSLGLPNDGSESENPQS